ncbi:MAG: 2-isopropylmalate synthase [Bacillota bacterium]|nr:2-isopropylmalate synthase [Bacillota bacterium]
MDTRIRIFDTTLRDGEQSPGAALTAEAKLEIARQLALLQVDVIEAGFPISSPGDFLAVKSIAESVRGPIIAGLARTKDADIDRAYEAVKGASKPRIHTFVATSDIHMRHKMRVTPSDVLAMTEAGVRRARSYVDDVEFSAEDATRSDPGFLCQVFQVAIEAGATTLNIPDTVGYTTPAEFQRLIHHIRDRVPGIGGVTLSVHCHNDLGLAVANSLAAVEAGVRQVECTVNGLGERAGNTALEEIVMALMTRKDHYACSTGVVTEQLHRTSRMVSALSGMPVQPNKAIVGANAFAHESGIHQDGVLKERTTYEIMSPQSIGLSSNRLVLGKLSGRHAFRERLHELGLTLDNQALERAFVRFKDLADRKGELGDSDLEAIVQEEIQGVPEVYRLDYFAVTSGSTAVPTATVALTSSNGRVQEAATGDGPVDAVYRAIERVVNSGAALSDWSIRAVSGGQDALGEVTLRLTHGRHTYLGRGVSTDILEASARAYLSAVNRLAQAPAIKTPSQSG